MPRTEQMGVGAWVYSSAGLREAGGKRLGRALTPLPVLLDMFARREERVPARAGRMRTAMPARAAAAIGILALAGCTVGPNFKRPEPPKVSSFVPASAAPAPATADSQQI